MSFIKFFCITLCSFYLFKKLLKLSNSLLRGLFDCMIAITLAAFMVLTSRDIRGGGIFAVVVLFCMICRFYYQQPTTISVVTGIVAYGLAYVVMSISGFVILPIVFLFPWLPSLTDSVDAIGTVLAGVFQWIIVIPLFRVGRLKNGMPYLREKRAGWFGVLISLIFLLATSFIVSFPGEDARVLVYIILAAESGFVLFTWWYYKILHRYLERIKNNKLEQLQTEVRQLENNNSAILSDNMELAKIIHTDSKVVPAMGTMLKEILNTADFPIEENKARAAEFLEYIDRSVKERMGQFFEYNNKSRELPQTDNPGIDSMIRHMASRAYEQGISFNFMCPASIKHLTQETISSGDLSKLIGDLAENAIIAERDCEIREIFLSIQVRDACYVLDIADTGTAFTSAVIEKLGAERVTTHADTGGSGLGLLSILEITKKANASFGIDDALNEWPFTKRISIYFDGMGQIRIKTERTDILSLKEIRNDILWI